MLQHEWRRTGEGKQGGGTTSGMGISINWQHGLCGPEMDQNGAFVEDVIASARARLEFFQDGELKCQENDTAIRYLTAAIEVLEQRTKKRVDRGVAGTYQP